MSGTYKFKTGKTRYPLEAEVLELGEDLVVALWGGERPHIGAVAMAEPRPSLKDPQKTSATASVFTYLGHKEDLLAKETAETLASALKRRVVVAAGIHWDDLSPEGIRQVLENAATLREKIQKRFQRYGK
jgi:hypothetical protein